ncbi:MAG: alpha/beta fold hydrolase [Candidatus Nanoarchaeia archaeon]
MKVKFMNSKGGTLVGVLHKPLKKSKSAVLFLHGFTGFKEQFRWWAEYISLHGFITLAFDFTGNGESDGFFTEGTISQEVSDIDSAIKFLKENYGVEKICVLGHSMGGAVAILSAAKNKDIDCLVVLAPLAVLKGKPYSEFANEMADILDSKGLCNIVNCKKMRSLDMTFFKDVSKHDVLKAVKKVKVPILVIHGDADSIVKVKEGKMIYNAAVVKNKKIHIIKGADHDFAKGRFFLTNLILDWCRKFLK